MNPLDARVEAQMRQFVRFAEVGDFIDISFGGDSHYEVQCAVTKYCMRYIRKQLGNIDGTFSMSYTVHPGHYRVTLLKSLEGTPIRDPEWDTYQRLIKKFSRMEVKIKARRLSNA